MSSWASRIDGQWLWRWSLPAVAVSSWAGLVGISLYKPTLISQPSTLLTWTGAWAVVSVWASLTGRNQIVTARLRQPSALPLILLGKVASLLAIGVWRGSIDHSWVPLLLTTVHFCASTKSPVKNLAAVAFSIALLEGTLVVLGSSPQASAHPIVNHLGRLLYHSDYAVIQFLPQCARYDPQLTYTLKPGGCVFANAEFTESYEVNSLGVRDDEDSLRQPEIVVVGDSSAMGWGVGQEQAFPGILEQRSGQKVLNASVSSYGTVRELMLLARVDMSRTEVLVLQYSANDFAENEEYLKNGNFLPVSTVQEYSAIVRQLRQRYYPGRYFYVASNSAVANFLARFGWGTAYEFKEVVSERKRRLQEVETFLRVLQTSPVNLSELRIFITEVNGFGERREWFIPLLQRTIRQPNWRNCCGAFNVIDVDCGLVPEDYFVLDNHINAVGHRKVAEILWDSIATQPQGGSKL